MPNLYPQVNLPSLNSPQVSGADKKLRVAPNFDFATGDFLRDAAGRLILADARETFAQWCQKVVLIDRGTRLAYSDKIGTEIFQAVKHSNNDAAKSRVEKTITEALMIHPAVQSVSNFEMTAEADSLQVSFVVKARDWAEVIPVTVNYRTN